MIIIRRVTFPQPPSSSLTTTILWQPTHRQRLEPGIDFCKIGKQSVLDHAAAKGGNLPTAGTDDALRKAINEAHDSPIKQELAELLKPADDYGRWISFRAVWGQKICCYDLPG